MERKFYPYQVEVAYRIVESILLHQGDVITILMARQMGKTELLGALVAALAIILPELAKKFPLDWKLNITDERAVYRGFSLGFHTGIYAPRLDQAAIMFDRVRMAFDTDTTKKLLHQMGLKMEVSNGNLVRLSNGSTILCESASEQSKIEGRTHHLVIGEEAQDISDLKMKKSLHPMVSSTLGTIVKVGTATTRKCDFYNSIKANQRLEMVTSRRNHFFYPYTVGLKYNSFYRQHIEREKVHLGEESDEFRTSYGGEWIFERGMFVTQEQLFDHDVAQIGGAFSLIYTRGLPFRLTHFSLVAAIDWGQSHDSTVLTLMAVNWKEPLDEDTVQDEWGLHRCVHYRKHIVGWLEFLGDNYEHQFENISAFIKNYPKLEKIVTDSNTCGKPLLDRLTSVFVPRGIEVCGFNFQSKLKSDGYKSLYSDFCARRLTFPAGEEARKTSNYRKFCFQMQDLRKDYRNGLMVVSHPAEKGAHDDYPDSVMMAAWGCNEPARSNRLDFDDNNPFIA